MPISSDRVIPTPAAPTVCTFTVLSDGTPVSGEHEVLSIVVHKELNRIPTATLVLRDGSVADQGFEASDTDLFVPGRNIEIKAGYRGTEDTVFKGLVVSHGIKLRNQSSVLQIVCKDKAVRMTVGTHSRYFRDMTDSDVLEEVIGQNNLEAEVEATSEQHREIVQFDASDWDFVMTRAESIGKFCLVDDGKLTIAAPDFAQNDAQVLQFGGSILDFDAEMDARTQFDAVKSFAWGIADQALRESEESSSTVREAGNFSASDLAAVHGVGPLLLPHSGNLTEGALQDWAKSALQKSRLAKIRGRVKFQGLATLQPGQLVKLQGVGERFEGSVFVSAVRHEISNGQWVTDAQFGMSPEWFAERYQVQRPLAGGLLPAVQGLQVAVVTQLENDPDGEQRIMVRMPVIDPDDEGSWARVATLDAGNNRGSFFLPEIGDEVIVGFLNNDPRHPVVLGACNSSAKPAPLTATDDNHEKGFVTRSGMKWLFNDDKKNVLLETPDGNKILVSGEDKAITIEDQHGNKIVLDAAGITLESASDITLKATGALKAEAATVEIKANGTAEFSASGSTTIKGGIVQIN
jgi:Rhs element Vgr protein